MNVLNRAVAKAEGSSARSPAVSVDASKAAAREPAVSLAAIDDLLHSNAAVFSQASPTQATAEQVVMGYLRKKAGGQREGSTKGRIKQNWRKRYFVLASSKLKYYKDEAAHASGKTELGALDVRGCTLFLKQVDHHGVHRFTIASAERELKLRADSEADYQRWVGAVRPLAATFRELDAEHELQELDLDEADDDEVDDDERAYSAGLDSTRARSTTAATQRGRGLTMMPTGDAEGWLEKKAGGKEGNSSLLGGALHQWDKRYFVIKDGTTSLRSARVSPCRPCRPCPCERRHCASPARHRLARGPCIDRPAGSARTRPAARRTGTGARPPTTWPGARSSAPCRAATARSSLSRTRPRTSPRGITASRSRTRPGSSSCVPPPSRTSTSGSPSSRRRGARTLRAALVPAPSASVETRSWTSPTAWRLRRVPHRPRWPLHGAAPERIVIMALARTLHDRDDDGSSASLIQSRSEAQVQTWAPAMPVSAGTHKHNLAIGGTHMQHVEDLEPAVGGGAISNLVGIFR